MTAKPLIPCLLLLFLFTSCQKRPTVIPEITAQLTEKTVATVKGTDVSEYLFVSGQNIFIVDHSGKIYGYSSLQESFNFVYNLGSRLDPAKTFLGNDIIVFKVKDKNELLVFGFEQQRIIQKLTVKAFRQVVACSGNTIVYLKRRHLMVRDIPTGNTIKQVEMPELTVFNSASWRDLIIILTDRSLITVDPVAPNISSIPLKVRASSGFLLQGDMIYFGSESRELIKFSLPKRNIHWRFPLPKVLKLKPAMAGSFIQVSPEDNNIYFLKSNGSVHWWSQMDATRRYTPVSMKDNVAVLLLSGENDKKLAFFNFKNQKVNSIIFSHRTRSQPVFLQNGIYLLTADDDTSDTKMTRFSNINRVDIKAEPEQLKPVNRTIRFKFQAVNLIEPELEIFISDSKGHELLRKSIAAGESKSMAWIPELAGDYTMKVITNSKNRSNLVSEMSFRVIDPKMILGHFYYLIHRRSITGHIDPSVRKRQKK